MAVADFTLSMRSEHLNTHFTEALLGVHASHYVLFSTFYTTGDPCITHENALRLLTILN